MKIKDIYKEASLSSKGKFWSTLGIILLYGITIGILEYISLTLQENAPGFINIIVSIALLLISPAFAFGLVNQIYNIAHDTKVSAFGFIVLGINNFKKVWCMIGRKIQKLLLPFIITILSIIIASTAVTMTYFDSVDDVLEGSTSTTIVNPDADYTKVAILFAIIAVAAGIWTYIKSLKYIVSEYILIEDNSLTGKELVERSAKMTDGFKGTYFLMLLSIEAIAFIAVILGIVLCTIISDNLIKFIIIIALVIGGIYLSILTYYLKVAFYDLLKDENTLNSTTTSTSNTAEE